MTNKNLEYLWKNLIAETHDKPDFFPDEVVRNRELLTLGGFILGKAQMGENREFYLEVHQMIMNQYIEQKLLLGYGKRKYKKKINKNNN